MAVMLAKTWSGTDPAGWWMSEKLDGVRAWWNGYRLTTRTGNEIHAPASFVASLPVGITLDGELWAGRRTFQSVSGAYRRIDEAAWRPIRVSTVRILTRYWRASSALAVRASCSASRAAAMSRHGRHRC